MALPLPTMTEAAQTRPNLLERLRAFGTIDSALAIGDQVLVSGASFAATLLIGRVASAELGRYALAVSVLATVIAVQNALVLLPYTIRRHRTDANKADETGEALALSGALSLVAGAACLLVAAVFFAIYGAEPTLIATLGVAMPFLLLREFARRYAFAQLSMRTVLTLDTATVAIQLTGLAALAATHRLGTESAFAVLGLSCAIPGLAWVSAARRKIAWRLGGLASAARRSWSVGKWLLLGQLTVQLQSYGVYWLSGIIAGVTVTGVYAACMSIVGFANPVIFGLANIMTPKLALAWQREGGDGIRREAARNALLLGLLMALFCVVVAITGEDLMELLLPGHEYQDHGATLTLLAAATLATAIGMPASNALASMERPRAIVVVGGVGATVTVVLVAVLMTEDGLIGAAYGFLFGSMIGALGRWIAFLVIARKAHEPPPPADVLHTLTGTSGDIVRLGGGDYASVYAVAGETDAAVVKIYRSGSDPAIADAEFVALERLAQALDGRGAGGWTICVPHPRSVSSAPLALKMTRVPGRALEQCATGCSPQLLQQAAEAFAATMAPLWASGDRHGDLGLRNVLFDFDARTIALLDPGTQTSCPVCQRAAFGAAALDLGHLAAELTTDVNGLVGGPLPYASKQTFVVAALRAAVRDGDEGLRDKVRAALGAHLDETLAFAHSPRGIWNRVVRSIAERRIADLFAGIAVGKGP